MATQLQIANLALTRLGTQRISSLTDGSKAALAISAVWDFVRDEVLAKHPWNRCVERADIHRLRDASRTITGLTSASPAVVTTSTPHDFQVGDVVFIDGVRGILNSSNESAVNGLYAVVGSIPTATTWSISGLDTTVYTAYSAGGVCYRISDERRAEAIAATAITKANPAVVTLPSGHGLVNGDPIYIDGIASGEMPEANGLHGEVYAVSATTCQVLRRDGTLLNSSAFTAAATAASVYKVLGALTEWDYQYALPADCLRVLDLTDETGEDWQIEAGGVLVTDAGAPLGIRYIKRTTAYALFEPLLVNALAARLAGEVAADITGSPAKKQAMMSEYLAFVAEAQGSDAKEQTAAEYEWDTWMTERF